MQVLIIDRNTLSRENAQAVVLDCGYAYRTATTVQQAMDYYTQAHFDIVLVECAIHDEDDTHFFKHIRMVRKSDATYFMVYCTEDDRNKIVNAIEAGADDYIIMRPDGEELKLRLQIAAQVLKVRKSPRSTNARLERGLQQAAIALKSMLPPARSGPDFQVEWLFRPCALVGGDLFNVVALDKDHICIYALDVSGHEITSALFAVTIGNMLLPRRPIDDVPGKVTQQFNLWNQSPQRVADTLNQRCQMDSPMNMNMYATLFYGVLDRTELTLRWIRAGHPSPIVMSEKGKSYLLTEGDPPIGLFPEIRFTEHVTKLKRNDRLFIYSDGIIEAAAPLGDEMFGTKRLIALLTDLYNVPLGNLIPQLDSSIIRFRGSDWFDDDLSLLAIEVR